LSWRRSLPILLLLACQVQGLYNVSSDGKASLLLNPRTTAAIKIDLPKSSLPIKLSGALIESEVRLAADCQFGCTGELIGQHRLMAPYDTPDAFNYPDARTSKKCREIH